MPLAGLILPDTETGASDVIPALLPIAGQTLIEYQVRVARACGVGHIVVVVETLPAGLLAAFDRLRADGIDIDLARTAADAADRIHPDEHVVVISNGVVCSRAVTERLVRHDGPVLLTVRDHPDAALFELIDAQDRWSGLALLPGSLLRKTAAMIGDWTLGPTVLRSAVQAGIRRERVDEVAMVVSPDSARQAAAQLLAGDAGDADLAIDALAFAKIAGRITPWAIARAPSFALLALVPAFMLALGLALAAAGQPLPGYLLHGLAGLPLLVARRVADVAARRSRLIDFTRRARLPALVAMMLVQGWALDGATGGWGGVAAALWGGTALALQPAVGRKRWMADAGWAALIAAVGTALGQPAAGLALIVAHAVVTQFLMIRTLR